MGRKCTPHAVQDQCNTENAEFLRVTSWPLWLRFVKLNPLLLNPNSAGERIIAVREVRYGRGSPPSWNHNAQTFLRGRFCRPSLRGRQRAHLRPGIPDSVVFRCPGVRTRNRNRFFHESDPQSPIAELQATFDSDLLRDESRQSGRAEASAPTSSPETGGSLIAGCIREFWQFRRAV